MTLGCADPVERIEMLKANDPRRQGLVELYEVWWDNHEDHAVKAVDLAEPARNLIDPRAGAPVHRDLPRSTVGYSSRGVRA